MKNVFLAIMLLFIAVSCTQSPSKVNDENEVSINDSTAINVFYFHGKQRCKTCIAVGNVAQETVEKYYQNNDNIHFIELSTEDEKNEWLIERFDVSWNALIIAKGKQYEDITENAFATAVKKPEKLSDEIKSIIESLLKEN